MKERLTSILTVAAFLFLGFGGVVLAASADVMNDTTGSNSENNAELDIDKDFDFDLDNDADVDNDVDVHANTGHNEANENTGDGEVETGDVEIALAIANELSFDWAMNGMEDGEDWELAVGNHQTGANSENNAEVDVDSDVDVDVDNDVDIDNDVDFHANTGYNEANENTGSGSVRTGGVAFDASFNNNVALGGMGFWFPSMGGGSVNVSNNTTGANSSNNAQVDVDHDVDIDVDNNIDLKNDVNVYANTGHNEANENTGDGSVSTGDVSGTFEFTNTVQ